MAWYYNSFVAALIMLLTNQSHAYPTPVDFDGNLLRWQISTDNPVVTFEIIADDENDKMFYESAVFEAVSLWNDVNNSFLVYEEAEVGEVAKVTININENSGDAYSSGYAIFDESDDDGPIHCDIIVGTDNTYEGFAKTILHEMGHCFGLGHSLIPTAIMSYKLDQNGFELDLDDIAAISRLYPADGSEAQLPLGCGVTNRDNGLPVALFFLPIILMLFLNRGSKSREFHQS
jgi:hypothetical protein